MTTADVRLHAISMEGAGECMAGVGKSERMIELSKCRTFIDHANKGWARYAAITSTDRNDVRTRLAGHVVKMDAVIKKVCKSSTTHRRSSSTTVSATAPPTRTTSRRRTRCSLR